MNTAQLGARIKELRLRRKLTQARVAIGAGLATDSIYRIEKGHFSPTFDTLIKIADGLGIHPTALFSDDYDQADDLANLIRTLPEGHKNIAYAVLGALYVQAAVE